MSPDAVVQLAEIAKVLGVAKRTAAKYVDLPTFPAPHQTLSTGRIWDRALVEAWGREHLPLPIGRPRRGD